jgi:Flp pilus assembly pilin Flp
MEGRELHAPLLERAVSEQRRRHYVKELLNGFLRNEEGQDLIEYTLLLAFVCLASAALFVSAGGSVSGIWTTANTDLATANTAAAS